MTGEDVQLGTLFFVAIRDRGHAPHRLISGGRLSRD
jgi:hypothetical protein